MRIGVVHSYYNSAVPSGENVVVTAQIEALREAGHDVGLVAQYSDERRKRRSWPLEAAATTITGVGPDPTPALETFAPDVVHVHNLFPNFGDRWLSRWRGPLVATLHNFRPMCAVGTFSRDGRRCTLCVDAEPFAGVRHSCFRGSKAATFPVNFANRRGPTRHPVVSRADRLVTISERATLEYTSRGVDRSRFAVVPNFVTPPPLVGSATELADERWVYTGRLSREKGLPELMAAWPPGRRLDVIGDGENAGEIRTMAPGGVRFLGGMSNDDVRGALPNYTGLIVSSQWPEAGPPLNYMEALAAGVPVLAFAGNGASDDVADKGTGVVVPATPTEGELVAGLDNLKAGRAGFVTAGRTAYESHYTARVWAERITDVYQNAATPTSTPARH